MSVEFFNMSELQRNLRTYILEDVPGPDNARPIMVCAIRTMDFSDHGVEKRILKWLRDTDAPVETFQIFPLTYIVFYDMADVLMMKLAVDLQD